MTWGSEEEETGWGNCFLDECEDLKRKFETEYEGKHRRFFKYWPQGYRWTCCGTDGSMTFGCDHHGTGPNPCTCDFCRYVLISLRSRHGDTCLTRHSFLRSMGKPLPDSVYNDPEPSRRGLRLARGPDPRSFNAGIGAITALGRALTGMDEE